jgi:cache domain-containing protein
MFVRAYIFIAMLLFCLTYGSSLNFGIVEASNRTEQSGLSLADSNMSTSNDVLQVQVLARSLENRLNDSAAILEATSSLPEVRSTPNASLLNSTLETLHGIPQDSDIEKRRIAQAILSNFDDFAVVTYIMPNGDMYFLEPYTLQQNQTRNNFAFRDYFRGAMDTNGTYLGDIITSTASGLKQAVIAVPVHSEGDDGNLIEGVWVGAIDLGRLNGELQSFNLSDNQRIVYVDSNGTKIADSDKELASNNNETFSGLSSFLNAIAGKSGLVAEEVNQKTMVVSYHPVKALQKLWAVLWMQQQESK